MENVITSVYSGGKVSLKNRDIGEREERGFRQKIPWEALTLKSWGVIPLSPHSLPSTQLYEVYREFCSGHGLPYCGSALSFGKKLLIFLRDSIIAKNVTRTAAMYYKP